MKRIWFGAGLLLVMLALGIATTLLFARLHLPLQETLTQAAHAALEEDWETAVALTAQAKADWDKYRDFTAAMADHEPLEEMEAQFARLELLAAQQETDEFAADCIELAHQAQAMADSQAFNWWSIL